MDRLCRAFPGWNAARRPYGQLADDSVPRTMMDAMTAAWQRILRQRLVRVPDSGRCDLGRVLPGCDFRLGRAALTGADPGSALRRAAARPQLSLILPRAASCAAARPSRRPDGCRRCRL